MKVDRIATLVLIGVVASASATLAQHVASGGGRGVVAVAPGLGFKITESTPIEVTPVKNAPFAAQAVTEFMQTLEDGNRIERRYQSSIARDSRGRTRREEEIALIGRSHRRMSARRDSSRSSMRTQESPTRSMRTSASRIETSPRATTRRWPSSPNWCSD